MALNFPSPANQGDTYTADNGITYTYDGTKWLGTAGGGGNSFDQSLNTTNDVTFNNLTMTGTLVFPNYVTQNTNISVRCDPNMDTIIYTATNQWQHTFKLLLKVEGNEVQGQNGWDTQSCEMMIAKSYNGDKVAGSVYGLVYTSNNPLATFTTRWNSSTNRVEVLCRPTSTTEYVDVRSFVTEITTSA